MTLLISVVVAIFIFCLAPVDFLEDRLQKWGKVFGKENKNKVKATDKDGNPLN